MADYFKGVEYLNELKALDLSLVTNELKAYNKRFSLGSLMARSMLRHVGERDKIGAAETTEEENQAAFLKRIEGQYGIVLTKAGVSLEPVSGPAAIFSTEGVTDTSELKINLANRTDFLTYLSALDAKTISVSQVQGLKTVSESLESQLREHYVLDKPDPVATEALADLGKIVEFYKSLDPEAKNGLADSVKTLERYSQVAKKGYIREYLLVERSGLLAEVGGYNFGPSKWHTDSTEQLYDRNWKNALDTLNMLKKNAQAQELYIQLAQHLTQSANYAKADLASAETQSERVKAKLKTIQSVLSALNRGKN